MSLKRLMLQSWRLLIFFVGTIIVISALLPFQLAGLGGDNVSNSPFVTVFNYIGIPYADDIIRFVIITALLSAANSIICSFTYDVVFIRAKAPSGCICNTFKKRNTYCCFSCNDVRYKFRVYYQSNLLLKPSLKTCQVLQLLPWLLSG